MELSAFDIAGWIGTVAFALSGFLLGVRHNLDAMGLFIVAMLTANGGGAVRDVLVGKVPNVLTNDEPFFIVLAVVLFSILFRIHKFAGLERRLFFVISDSVGLVAFSITGAMVAINADLTLFGVMALAFITATGGGIIRDILLNEVPAVLDSGFYGSVALLIAIALFALDAANMVTASWIIYLVAVIALGIRLVAHFQDWHLPRIKRGHPFVDE